MCCLLQPSGNIDTRTNSCIVGSFRTTKHSHNCSTLVNAAAKLYTSPIMRVEDTLLFPVLIQLMERSQHSSCCTNRAANLFIGSQFFGCSKQSQNTVAHKFIYGATIIKHHSCHFF